MDYDALKCNLKAIASFLDDARLLTSVEGYLLEIQGFTLMKMASDGPGVGAIVEIGSFKGRSTCYLALGSKRANREPVYAIDHFEGSPEHQQGAECATKEIETEGTTFNVFTQNIEGQGLSEYVRPIVASSREASATWDQPIRLLFIDGDHSYEASKEDFECWEPFVVPGGLIAFHDIGHGPGVTEFYNELVTGSSTFTQVLGVVGLNVLRKGS